MASNSPLAINEPDPTRLRLGAWRAPAEAGVGKEPSARLLLYMCVCPGILFPRVVCVHTEKCGQRCCPHPWGKNNPLRCGCTRGVQRSKHRRPIDLRIPLCLEFFCWPVTTPHPLKMHFQPRKLTFAHYCALPLRDEALTWISEIRNFNFVTAEEV